MHRAVISLKHWQAFLCAASLIGLVGYPLYALGRYYLGWEMYFSESPAPAIALYIYYGIWFGAIMSSGGTPKQNQRLSGLFLFLFALAALWLRKDQPSPSFIYIVPLYVLVIAWISLVVFPTAKAIRAKEQPLKTNFPFWLDVILIAAYFPFGVWILQPRLNTIKLE